MPSEAYRLGLDWLLDPIHRIPQQARRYAQLTRQLFERNGQIGKQSSRDPEGAEVNTTVPAKCMAFLCAAVREVARVYAPCVGAEADRLVGGV